MRLESSIFQNMWNFFIVVFFYFWSSKISLLIFKKNMWLEIYISGNIRNFLILELESFISWNIRNFSGLNFVFIFLSSALKVHQEALQCTTLITGKIESCWIFVKFGIENAANLMQVRYFYFEIMLNYFLKKIKKTTLANVFDKNYGGSSFTSLRIISQIKRVH